jgi:hypothetical protein
MFLITYSYLKETHHQILTKFLRDVHVGNNINAKVRCSSLT